MPTYVPFSTSLLDSPVSTSLLDRPVSTSLLDSLITPATLAARLGLTQRTLSEKRITGTGPAYIRTGKSVRYTPESVDRWLTSREYHSTSEEVR